MLPYLTPDDIRRENEQRVNGARFDRMSAGVRAELDSRLAEEAEVALLKEERPVSRPSFRLPWLRPAFWRLQRNLK